ALDDAALPVPAPGVLGQRPPDHHLPHCELQAEPDDLAAQGASHRALTCGNSGAARGAAVLPCNRAWDATSTRWPAPASRDCPGTATPLPGLSWMSRPGSAWTRPATCWWPTSATAGAGDIALSGPAPRLWARDAGPGAWRAKCRRQVVASWWIEYRFEWRRDAAAGSAFRNGAWASRDVDRGGAGRGLHLRRFPGRPLSAGRGACRVNPERLGGRAAHDVRRGTDRPAPGLAAAGLLGHRGRARGRRRAGSPSPGPGGRR